MPDRSRSYQILFTLGQNPVFCIQSISFFSHIIQRYRSLSCKADIRNALILSFLSYLHFINQIFHILCFIIPILMPQRPVASRKQCIRICHIGPGFPPMFGKLLQPFFQFLLDCSITIAQCSILFLLYRRLREGDAAPEDTQNGKPVCAKGRRLLATAVVGVTLVTIGLSFIYIALPADDELRTMLGGAAPIVTAHRGYSTAAPENTLPAFQLAIDHHSDRAELDVQMTKDGVVMVTHDTSLRRCTGCNANIYNLPYAQVQQLDAGRWFHRQFTGAYIPTLEEVLALCKGKAELNIEIKPSTFTPTLESETVRLIHAYDYGADCVVTSQSYETLCKVKELDPDITTGYILALGVGTYYDLPAADFFSVESTFITAGMVQQIHLRGKTISAWTINRQQDAEKLLQLGVDDLITDKPEIIAPLLARDKALDNRLLWLRDQIQELFAAPDAEETMEVEETIEDAIEDPEEVLDEA